MTRWDDWTWEERSQANRTPTVEPEASSDTPQDGVGGQGRRTNQVFRRRRAGAGIGAIVVVALLIAALTSHKNPQPAAHANKPHVAAVSPDQAERAAADFKAEQEAINSVLAYTPAVTSGGTKGNEVALTFDDGPGPYTQQLVAELNRLKVHATFFAIGNQEQYFSAGTVAEVIRAMWSATTPRPTQ